MQSLMTDNLKRYTAIRPSPRKDKIGEGGKRGRILIHPPLLKWPLSLRGTSGERGLGRGARSIELSRSFEIPSPSPHFSVVGRGNRPRAWWWYQDAPASDRPD